MMTALTFDQLISKQPLGRRSRRRGGPWARLEAPAAATLAAATLPRGVGRVAPGVREHHRVLRRRRLAAVAVLMMVAFAAGMVLAVTVLSSPAGGSLTDEGRRARQVTYVVQPGDTLWRAAEQLAPGADPRIVVDALSSARGTSEIRPGEVLVWPGG